MAATELEPPAAEPLEAPELAPPGNRMAIALLALVGTLISVYMLLYKLGVFGVLLCGEGGGCERVQASEYAVFLGAPVPLWGVLGYGALLALALAGLQPRLAGARGVAAALLGLATGAFLFSLYLTGIEAFVLHDWCRWCVASAIVATLTFAASLPELPRIRSRA